MNSASGHVLGRYSIYNMNTYRRTIGRDLLL
jgi:hypothetical protein